MAALPNTMSRTRGEIAAGDPECLHLSILLRGHLHGAQHHRECVLSPGDMTTYDTSEPAIFRAGEPFDLLVLKLPKATLGKHAANVSRQTAVRIPGQTGLPRLAVRFFCGAAAGLADGSIARNDTGLAEHVIDLVRRLYLDVDATQSEPPALPGRAAPARPGLHRRQPGQPQPQSRAGGPRLLHLHALPAPACSPGRS